VSVEASSDARGLTAAAVLGIIGALTIFIAPGFLGLVADQGRLGDAGAGYVISSDIDTMAVAIAVATLLITRISWRQLALVGLGLIAAGSLATAFVHAEGAFIAARVCAGAGEGLAVGVSFAALGQARNPDRAFGGYLAAGLTISAVILLLVPVLQPHFGTAPFFIGIAVLAVLSGALVPWLSVGNTSVTAGSSGPTGIHWRLAGAGLLGVFLYFLAQGAVWSYFGEIGAASGVQADFIGRTLAISSMAGIGGALLAVLIATRFGRAWPLIASAGASAVSFLVLRGHVSASVFVCSAVLFNAAWNFSMPFLSGLCADADCRGRVVCAMGCIQTVGTGLGPAAAASLLGQGGFSAVLWMSLAVLVLSLVIVLAGLRAHRRETAVHAMSTTS
jgi:DHA1 family inner membrane transport protein